mgnify:CR=1 FL=1
MNNIQIGGTHDPRVQKIVNDLVSGKNRDELDMDGMSGLDGMEGQEDASEEGDDSGDDEDCVIKQKDLIFNPES